MTEANEITKNMKEKEKLINQIEQKIKIAQTHIQTQKIT